MPDIRISASSYSNTAPLVWSFIYGSNRGRYELIMDNAPARSAELLAQKRVDAALVPVIEYQRIPDLLLVPDVCVGTRDKVRSVCLVTKGEELSEVKTAVLDISSKTSVTLSKIIFQEFIGITPEYSSAKPDIDAMLSSADCALLIGDPALTVDESRYRKFDLSGEWKSRTGLGFVFAMWTAQKERADVARSIDFAGARDEGLQHLDDIISNYQQEIKLERDDFKDYLTENIVYEVDDSMKEGLALYYKLAGKHGLIDSIRNVEFI